MKLCFKVDITKLEIFIAFLANAIDSFLLCHHFAILYETGIVTCIALFQRNFHIICNCVVIISVD